MKKVVTLMYQYHNDMFHYMLEAEFVTLVSSERPVGHPTGILVASLLCVCGVWSNVLLVGFFPCPPQADESHAAADEEGDEGGEALAEAQRLPGVVGTNLVGVEGGGLR